MISKTIYLTFLAVAVTQLGTSHRAFSSEQFEIAPSGQASIHGVVEATGDPNVYKIGNASFEFAPGKLVNGTKFDEKSARAFVGQEIDGLIKTSPSGLNEMTAVIPSGLYSAATPNPTTDQIANYKGMFSSRGHFTFDPRKNVFTEYRNYRLTLLQTGTVKTGDTALIITFGGSQGDDVTADMGHFAFGQGIVQQDGTLQGEINNFYPVKNEKDIKPGHVNLVDYFGNTVSGQNQYRPTFTLIIYGVSSSLINDAKLRMNSVFEFLYTHNDFSFDINDSCTTEADTVLKSANLNVTNRNEKLKSKLYSYLADKWGVHDDVSIGIAKDALYFLSHDDAHFLPKDAFEAAMQNALINQEFGGEKVSRVDFVFQGQVPSARARGSLGVGGVKDWGVISTYFLLKKLIGRNE